MKVLVRLALALVSGPLYGWSVSLLWGWFVVPLGVRPIGMWHALGLGYLASRFTVGPADLEDDKTPGWQKTLASALYSLTLAGVGWIVHRLMGGV